MTEDELKQTWCPHVRMSVPGGGMVNRVSRVTWRNLKPESIEYAYFKDIEADCLCVGSACSQYRIGVMLPDNVGYRPVENEKAAAAIVKENKDATPSVEIVVVRYCGLGGRP